jgi:hypothetical protein
MDYQAGKLKLMALLSIQHQGTKASLNKMAIACDSIGQALLLHDYEGNTVSQAPGFVGTRLVEGESLHQQFGINTDDFDIVGTIALLNELNGSITVKCAQGITDFSKDGLCNPDFGSGTNARKQSCFAWLW